MEGPVERLGGARHGVGKQVHHPDLRPGKGPRELLAQRLGGGPVSHTEFSRQDQDLHRAPSFVLPLSYRKNF